MQSPPHAPPETAPTAPPSASAWPPRRRTIGLAAAGFALTLAAGATGSAVTMAVRGDRVTTIQMAAPPATTTGTTAPSEELAKAASTALPSVVTITITTPAGTGLGSGVALSSAGAVLTNNHVIAEAANGNGSVTVTTAQGRTIAARIVGQDATADLAVLSTTGVPLTPAVLGSAATLNPGDTVIAIGSPLGLSGSVSVGVVSALHRTVTVGHSQQLTQQPSESLQDAIQTDASINPGNSGGPLIDTNGRVVGICTAIATLGGGYIGQQSGSIGVGFAIPIDTAYRIAQQLLAH